MGSPGVEQCRWHKIVLVMRSVLSEVCCLCMGGHTTPLCSTRVFAGKGLCHCRLCVWCVCVALCVVCVMLCVVCVTLCVVVGTAMQGNGRSARPATALATPASSTRAPGTTAATAMRAHPNNPFIALLQPPSTSAGPPGSAPAPNPWGAPLGLGTAGGMPGTSGGTNPFAAMFGGGAPPTGNPLGAGAAQTTGPMGGLGGLPQATPEALSQMESVRAYVCG